MIEQLSRNAPHHRAVREPWASLAGIVLVVDEDDEAREAIATTLLREGYCVLTCSGPLPPAFSCTGAQGEDCPFAAVADAVVLDLRLEADTIMEGVPGWQLLSYYAWLGKPVIALSDDPLSLSAGEPVVLLRGAPSEREIAAAVRQALTPDRDVLDLTDRRRREARRRA